MLDNKVSQFLKKRYFLDSDDEVISLEKSAPEEVIPEKEQEPVPVPLMNPEPAVDEVVELDKEFLDYEKSNQGRSYGWWVCIDGERVASLEYRCLLEEPVFLYTVNVLSDRFMEIDLDPKKWIEPNVSLQSRYAGDYEKRGLNMAAVGKNMIVVDGLILPESVFRAKHKELEAFHDKLLNKAKSKAKG